MLRWLGLATIGLSLAPAAIGQTTNLDKSCKRTGLARVIQEGGITGVAAKYGSIDQNIGSLSYSNSFCPFDGSTGRADVSVNANIVEEDGRKAYSAIVGAGYTFYLSSEGQTIVSLTPKVYAGYEWFDGAVEDQFVAAATATLEVNHGLTEDADSSRIVLTLSPQYSDRSVASSDIVSTDVDGDGIASAVSALGLDFPAFGRSRMIARVSATHLFEEISPQDQASFSLSWRPVDDNNNYRFYIEARYTEGSDDYQAASLALIGRW